MQENSILSILEKKQTFLKSCGNPLLIGFTAEEINTLSDLNELRCLKLFAKFPEDFRPTTDVFSCTKQVLEGDSIYRILEFCVLKNKVLCSPITSVFPKLR